jgi:hypothetical protein
MWIVSGGKEEAPTEDLNAEKKLPQTVDNEHVSESADQGTATAKAQEDAAQERLRQFNEEHERAALAKPRRQVQTSAVGYQTPFEIIKFRDEVQDFWSYLGGVCSDLYAQ